mmetsp:Transcript_8650/g.14642  ORF Transcript_8650/g.14642 Transcript_8650/m.14642 type:complete len:360 (-) Transcript_8650:173-1252(-)
MHKLVRCAVTVLLLGAVQQQSDHVPHVLDVLQAREDLCADAHCGDNFVRRNCHLSVFAITTHQVVHGTQTHLQELLGARADNVSNKRQHVVGAQGTNIDSIGGEIEQRASASVADLVGVRAAQTHHRPPQVTAQKLQTCGLMAQHVVEGLTAHHFNILTGRAQQGNHDQIRQDIRVQQNLNARRVGAQVAHALCNVFLHFQVAVAHNPNHDIHVLVAAEHQRNVVTTAGHVVQHIRNVLHNILVLRTGNLQNRADHGAEIFKRRKTHADVLQYIGTVFKDLLRHTGDADDLQNLHNAGFFLFIEILRSEGHHGEEHQGDIIPHLNAAAPTDLRLHLGDQFLLEQLQHANIGGGHLHEHL